MRKATITTKTRLASAFAIALMIYPALHAQPAPINVKDAPSSDPDTGAESGRDQGGSSSDLPVSFLAGEYVARLAGRGE